MSEVRALKFYIKEAIMDIAALKVVKHFVVTNLTTEEASAPQRLNVPLILNTVCNGDFIKVSHIHQWSVHLNLNICLFQTL